MKRTILVTIIAVLSFSWPGKAEMNSANPHFDITFPASASKDALDGRLLLLISTNNTDEPRFQISEDLTTQQVFGIDVDAWKSGETKTIDQRAFGYPIRSLSDIKPGEYWVQARLHR